MFRVVVVVSDTGCIVPACTCVKMAVIESLPKTMTFHHPVLTDLRGHEVGEAYGSKKSLEGGKYMSNRSTPLAEATFASSRHKFNSDYVAGAAFTRFRH